MKRLIVSALFASVFFIGISGLINSASAKLNSDAKALELINAARVAIGGEQNISEVRSMTIKGATTNFYEKAGIQDVKQGSVEFNFAFPGQYSKRIKIGTPGSEETDMILGEDIDVVKMEGDMPEDGKQRIRVFKNNGDEDIEWESDDSDTGKRKIHVKDGKVFVTKDDGSVEELKTDGKHKVIVMKDENGIVSTVDNVGDTDVNVWNSDDGNKEIRTIRVSAGHGGGEMARMTMALLLTAPGESLNYKYLGQTDVDGYPSNIVEVGSAGSSFKLFLDATSNLPRMISFAAKHMNHFVFKKKGGESKEELIQMKKEHHKRMMADGDSQAAERQIKFSDFRTVGSLTLPHRWSETSNGKAIQNTDITSFEINPADIDAKFSKGGDVVVKKRVKQN